MQWRGISSGNHYTQTAVETKVKEDCPSEVTGQICVCPLTVSDGRQTVFVVRNGRHTDMYVDRLSACLGVFVVGLSSGQVLNIRFT